ncbi:expressed unknown protein [Seminavis robusta]|uniref:Uncharacterized protein n=1 Tax=Seminavis robusta TaxID=568900 RepID=A0A9N8EZN3_9STRA|nr:expressed unknown protein [Seminavis robusta]|eukprot:Sro2117_g315220.1 n/a (148) ;mRNA; f:3440-3883
MAAITNDNDFLKRFSWGGMDESLLAKSFRTAGAEDQVPEADIRTSTDATRYNDPKDRRSSWGDLDSMLMGPPVESASSKPTLDSIGEEEASDKEQPTEGVMKKAGSNRSLGLKKSGSNRSLGGLSGKSRSRELRRKIKKSRGNAQKA